MHRRGGNRAHSHIIPAGQRISTLSTSWTEHDDCDSNIGSGDDWKGADSGSGGGWRWGADSGSGRLPHLGSKSKATLSANHGLQERQTEGKEARAS